MKLIKITQDHYVIVDDSEIKEGDHYINIELGNPFFGKIYKGVDRILNEGYSGNGYKNPDYFKTWMKKITHSTQPLEDVGLGKYDLRFNKIFALDLDEIKELIGEVDVEKKMISPYSVNTQNNVDWCNGYQRGYTQALEDNKDKKWTDEDVRRAYDNGYSVRDARGDRSDNMTSDEYVKSTQLKTEWEVELIDGKLQLK